eukprot:s10345_g3.t1
MATRPRWLADVLEGLGGADGAGDAPVGGADASALGPPSAEAIVEVPVVELPEDRAAQAFGRRLASEASGPASALGDSEPTAVQGHASEAAGASASLDDAAAVAGGAAGAMENVAELPGTPPAAAVCTLWSANSTVSILMQPVIAELIAASRPQSAACSPS